MPSSSLTTPADMYTWGSLRHCGTLMRWSGLEYEPSLVLALVAAAVKAAVKKLAAMTQRKEEMEPNGRCLTMGPQSPLQCTNIKSLAEFRKKKNYPCSGSMSVSFLSLYQIPEIINLWKEKDYFCPQFWRFQSMIDWPFCSLACAEAAHHSIIMWHSKSNLIAKKKKRARSGLRSHNPLQDTLQWPKDFQPGLTS